MSKRVVHEFPDYACFLVSGYGEELDFNVQQSTMESGLKKQRPGRRVPILTRKGQLLLRNKTDLENFKVWLKTIGNGVKYFNYRDPIRSHEVFKCRFVNQKWNFQYSGRVWRAECEMESLDE